MNDKILITGGAGYIGSHAVHMFCDLGYDVIVVDNLSTGFLNALPKNIKFYQEDIGEKNKISQILSEEKPAHVLHFAASIIVEESVKNPIKYYQNNTMKTISFIKNCIDHNIKNFIFSSTAAVYGNGSAKNTKMNEQSTLQPVNPYGYSKLMVERVLLDACNSKNNDMNCAILRYFNVAGADIDSRTGQNTAKATHLIKVAVETALGQREYMEIYGNDYNTMDGTCLRDYIHVTDLINAHISILNFIIKFNLSNIFNCGIGRGFSVKQVIERVKAVSGTDFDVRNAERRLGDPDMLIADPTLLMQKTGWQPKFTSLDAIITSAYAWEKRKMEILK